MQTRRAILCTASLGAAAMTLGRAAFAAPSPPPRPSVTGPIQGGKGRPFSAYAGDLALLGYVEEEFFLEGNATRFAPRGDLSADGKWSIKPSDQAPYKTRILVRRPLAPARFNGTVVVEWANVSGGRDLYACCPKGLFAGLAYVAVSAQRIGVHGYPSKPAGLLQWDPDRYAGLSILDDALSFDIFSQAARAVGPGRPRAGADPMAGLPVRRLIATGASQSGVRITAYTNGVQPLHKLFDATVPVICAGSASDFDAEPAHPHPVEPGPRPADAHSRSVPTRIRADLAIPVMVLNTETEALHYFPMRQPDTAKFRAWEVAGSCHAPRSAQMEADALGPSPQANDVSWQPTIDAALWHVHRWITTGQAPPPQGPIEVAGAPLAIQRDAFGNARGGVRLPELEVPIARYTASSVASDLRGEKFPFAPEQLKALYPTHEVYVAKVEAAANAARKAGVIPDYRVAEYVSRARDAAVPG